ncbi:MAG: aminodeoxychorismate/anthranilate synthase component II, partial [Bacteroidota bacterium]
MALLILDNYDSFTYNLVHLVEQYTDTFEVIRNDRVDLNDLDRFDRLLISPGPGLPTEAGQLRETLAAFAGQKPVLGVCLGMQAIVEHYGGILYNLPRVKHAISSRVTVCDRD